MTDWLAKKAKLLSKFNPNHDELGRFSSGPGGGADASAAAPKQDWLKPGRNPGPGHPKWKKPAKGGGKKRPRGGTSNRVKLTNETEDWLKPGRNPGPGHPKRKKPAKGGGTSNRVKLTNETEDWLKPGRNPGPGHPKWDHD